MQAARNPGGMINNVLKLNGHILCILVSAESTRRRAMSNDSIGLAAHFLLLWGLVLVVARGVNEWVPYVA